MTHKANGEATAATDSFKNADERRGHRNFIDRFLGGPNGESKPKNVEMKTLNADADPSPLLTQDGGQNNIVIVPNNISSSSVMIGGNGVLSACYSGRRDMKHGISDTQAMMNLIKGLVGTGILALPQGFLNAGLWTGLVLLLVIVCINIYCMHQLVNCAQNFCKVTGKISADYGEVAELCLSYGPARFRRYSKLGRIVVNSFIFATQLGFCCVYFVFIAESLRQVVYPGQDGLSVHAFIAFALPFVLLLCSVRHLKYLAIASAIANVLYCVGLIILFQYIFRDLPDSRQLPAFADWKKLPLFFGSVMFSFEGISLVLPIENKMYHPQNFLPFNGILNTSCFFVLALYAAVGFFGYIRFGEDIQASITLNLPSDPLYLAVKAMFAVAVFFTYAVQFYVPLEVVVKYIQVKFESSKRHQLLWEYFLRAALVIFTFCMAELIPHLGLFISLVGSVMSAALALIFPPILELLTFWETSTSGQKAFMSIKNFIICLIGLVGFATGTYASLEGIVEAFGKGAASSAAHG